MQRKLNFLNAWDATIRKQIKSCALFLALISKNTATQKATFADIYASLGQSRGGRALVPEGDDGRSPPLPRNDASPQFALAGS